eukprot:5807935-Prymnesium_polylepis.1
MLLSSYGADRSPAHSAGCGTIVMPSKAEVLARDSGNRELLLWLRESYAYATLHHVRVLTPHRAISLLRAGFSPHARSADGAAKSPAELAREHPRAPAAEFVLRAAEPWSPRTHYLWGANQRGRAVELCKLGYRLAHQLVGGGGQQGAFLDVWIDRVLRQAIS